jgi:HK97 family phage major capsid protein
MNGLQAKGEPPRPRKRPRSPRSRTELVRARGGGPGPRRPDRLAGGEQRRRSALFAAASAHGAARTFEPNPELTGGFKSITHFAIGGHGAPDRRLGGPQLEAAASNYMQNQGTAGEGYLVPPQYSQEVAEIAFNEPDLFGMANPEPTNSNTFLKPKDETTPWGASGVQAVWRAEAAQMTASKLALTGEISQLHELYAFCAASNEVLSDASMLQNRLTTQAGRAIAWTASEAVMWGSGAGQPTGFMKAPCLVTVAKEAARLTPPSWCSTSARCSPGSFGSAASRSGSPTRTSSRS